MFVFQGREFSGAAVDSRLVKEGELFFALKGDKVDGHAFIGEAFKRGAAAAVVQWEYAGNEEGLIRVDDVMATLHSLARERQEKRGERVVAITGSVGKTTTKEFTAHLLAGRYRVKKTPGNANSQTGFPLAILNSEEVAEVFVAEMGMNFPGEIERLVRIAPPEVALITKIGHSNYEFFKDGLEGIAAAKAEIFSHPETRIGFANIDTKGYRAVQQTGQCEKRYFDVEGLEGIELPFEASHLRENFFGAAAIAREMGVSDEEIRERAKTLQPFKQRFERLERNGITIINDCYNASPESMRAALSNLPKPAPGGKTIGALGGMAHLGAEAPQHHKALGLFALPYIDVLLCFDPIAQPIAEVFAGAGKPSTFFSDIESMKVALFKTAQPGDVVLIKGRNTNALWRLLE
jgi:UDP-N-acetylmuramoyl-tripeptide--D-alanyl-D-alanine ligase